MNINKPTLCETDLVHGYFICENFSDRELRALVKVLNNHKFEVVTSIFHKLIEMSLVDSMRDSIKYIERYRRIIVLYSSLLTVPVARIRGQKRLEKKKKSSLMLHTKF